jgi:hypothetical protein
MPSITTSRREFFFPRARKGREEDIYAQVSGETTLLPSSLHPQPFVRHHHRSKDTRKGFTEHSVPALLGWTS